MNKFADPFGYIGELEFYNEQLDNENEELEKLNDELKKDLDTALDLIIDLEQELVNVYRENDRLRKPKTTLIINSLSQDDILKALNENSSALQQILDNHKETRGGR